MHSKLLRVNFKARSRGSHLDRLAPRTLGFGCRSPRTAVHRTQAEGCCTAVSWTAFPSRRSHCTGSTAATAPSYQPLEQQKQVSNTSTSMLDKGFFNRYVLRHVRQSSIRIDSENFKRVTRHKSAEGCIKSDSHKGSGSLTRFSVELLYKELHETICWELRRTTPVHEISWEMANTLWDGCDSCNLECLIECDS